MTFNSTYFLSKGFVRRDVYLRLVLKRLEGYPLGPILGSDQCTLIPSPRPDLDGSLAFLVAAMVFQKLTSFSGKTESEVYRLAGPAVSILKESLQLLC